MNFIRTVMFSEWGYLYSPMDLAGSGLQMTYFGKLRTTALHNSIKQERANKIRDHANKKHTVIGKSGGKKTLIKNVRMRSGGKLRCIFPPALN